MIFFIYNIISFIFGAHYPIKFPKLQLVNNINLINDMDNIYSINSRYKKTIKYSKFLKEENNMQVFNYDTINEGYELDISSMFITNISDFVYNNIKPRNIKNEILFLLNKKTKIYIHIEQLFARTNIYHIGVTFKSLTSHIRYDVRGINLDRLFNLLSDKTVSNLYTKTLFWDYSNKTIDEIIEYEKTIDHKYILGIYDCRHYVRNLTYWSCNNPTPVWKLTKLIK